MDQDDTTLACLVLTLHRMQMSGWPALCCVLPGCALVHFRSQPCLASRAGYLIDSICVGDAVPPARVAHACMLADVRACVRALYSCFFVFARARSMATPSHISAGQRRRHVPGETPSTVPGVSNLTIKHLWLWTKHRTPGNSRLSAVNHLTGHHQRIALRQ